MTNKDNRPLIPDSWESNIKDMDSSAYWAGARQDKWETTKEKKMSKRKIYEVLADRVFRLYLWLSNKYWDEHDKLWNPEIKR